MIPFRKPTLAASQHRQNCIRATLARRNTWRHLDRDPHRHAPGLPHDAALRRGLPVINHQGQARIDVLIDDVVVTSRAMSQMDVQSVPVELPSGTGRTGSLMKVSLVTDSALVPQDVGLGSDFRCLGVLLVGIEWHQPAAEAQHNGVHHNGTQPKAESEAVLEVLSEIRSEANGEDSERDGMMAAQSAKKPRAAGWKAAPSPAKRPSVSKAGQTT